jgi:hypothetical protein
MATYVNNLRLKEITTGDEDGTWGTSTNTNLELITDGFSYGTKQMAADANETFTMPDATADATRGFYLKITSAVSLTATREVTLGPNTVSKVWLIENATTGSQIITIKQGSGATVNVANGSKVMVVTDGAGAGAAVLNANPSETGTGTVTSVGGTGTVNGITLTGTVTSSGNLTLGGTLANVDLTSQVTGTLPIANGGTGITSFGSGVADFLGTPSSANLATAVSDETGSGALVFATSPTLVTPVLGTPTSGDLTNCTADGSSSVGYRDVPAVGTKTTSYTLQTADVGKYVQVGSGGSITIPDGVFSEGDAVSIFNNTTGSVTITCSVTTCYKAGTDTDISSASLDTRGVATVLFISGTVAVITGNLA